MIFPCDINSNNGHNIKFIPYNGMNKRKIIGVLSISTLIEEKEFIFLNYKKLMNLYTCLLGIYKSINSKKNLVRTIELPSIKLDEYIGIFMNYNNNCLISLKNKHITNPIDTYKPVDIIEIEVSKLYVLIQVIGKVLYSDMEDE